MDKVSIIVPIYYNELNIPHLYEQMKEKILSRTDFEAEIVCVDDGSKDGSYKALLELREKDDRFKVVKLSRNFGSHTAILAGFAHATGDCMTMVAADLQEPLEIIIEMYEKWKQGKKVVIAVRKDREDGFFQKLFSNTYYSLMQKYALKDMPSGGFDCFFIDKKVRDVLVSMNEKNSSIVGQVLWAGFEMDKIYYVRKKREIGESKWTLSKKIKLFIDSFMAFSYVPIRFISTLGIFISIVGFILAVFLIVNKFMFNVPVQGWTTMMITLLMLSGIQMLTLGVIGEYLWRNFDESRGRPTYIVEETHGIDE
ncbi:dolichol-phosphate mannosyltransferase [Acetoanaerobium noterae]|jgi:dolichol-phosphate mannosyltransferase|uniref:Dolichol-phosphate mannosyltransferase n=1 Tax=Acetoanaerobium noterae TaxID=745369 RepID=A0A1T5B304_9FIRM|nr:glycosyltransferase family 2 protein [Acetoanaerobium noterae]MBP8763194.1 glycosyltransferase family 2 protein [Acetoanaerobium sp.]MDK2804099.1 polyisoprenyl-phosphate glycosyltransferase [Peptostreptococcaceae bacterium]MBP9499922.1 glycosyltransferase family 2 protein [Acetoanaerobium sp.]MBP9562757.1 glycosyltransferase family 2 protein [Acetoanaerobium sp.]SKB41636.1 dolichol-phosphate mannosyltransferase [Acetoanaerobium noterae]